LKSHKDFFEFLLFLLFLELKIFVSQQDYNVSLATFFLIHQNAKGSY
jgi:hypothetical protein